MDVYESEKVLAEYLLFHYGTADEILPWGLGPAGALDFAVRTSHWFGAAEVDRALDVGCAVGRSSFELSKRAKEVVGIDFSTAFVTAAEEVRREGRKDYRALVEGETFVERVARRPLGAEPERVSFETGDAMDLRADLGSFDRVHAANLVCRLSEPEKFLTRLGGLVKPGGELVLATPCTWLEEFTPKDNWPEGGTRKWLEETLKRDFALEAEGNEPFLIRETARKFQWSVSLVTKWRRREERL